MCFFTSAVGDDRFDDNETYLLSLTSNEPGLTLNPDVATVTIPNSIYHCFFFFFFFFFFYPHSVLRAHTKIMVPSAPQSPNNYIRFFLFFFFYLVCNFFFLFIIVSVQ